MTPETGAHARRRMPALRLVLVPVLLACAFALMPPPPSTAAEKNKEGSGEDSLRDPMAVIAKSFRTGRPRDITSLIPAEGKVFLSLDSLGGGPSGYYGRDQVYFIFRKMFDERKTIRFDIRPRRAGEDGRHKNRERLVYCIGQWAYRGKDGTTAAWQIHFALSMSKEHWTLVEIREAR